jgi:hypothetical protein
MANPALGMRVIAALALLQGVLGVLRALQWFRVGADLMNQGLLLLPMVGVVAWLRGFLVVVIALLFGVFAYGAWFRRDWAPPLGLVVAAVNILLVLSALFQGAAMGQTFYWLIVPVIMIGYLLSPAGRSDSKNS